ncbi:MAG TPA: hypothetical protein VNP92_12070 [Actinophytocola sp.]|nr:hypothetical protein [Actinophytocola sp.]
MVDELDNTARRLRKLAHDTARELDLAGVISQTMLEINRSSTAASILAVLAARLAASMTAHHAKANPHHRPDQCGHEGDQPKRHGDAPEQEVELDVLSVLDHEDEQEPGSRERGDRSATEPARLSFRG